MGEAKKRNLSNKKLLESNPPCVYCGGANIASTIEHFPARSIFDRRARPNDLIFAACASCNNSTSKDELVASVVSRVWPDVGDEHLSEFTKLCKAADKAQPGLLEEMQPSLRQSKLVRRLLSGLAIGGGAINCSGPIVSASMERFAAKHGFCLHQKITGRVVAPNGGVRVNWYTNKDFLLGEFPEELLSILGPVTTLEQGSWEVSGQFRYRSAATPDKAASMHLASYRESIAVVAFAADDIDRLRPADQALTGLFRTGCFVTDP